MNPKLARQVHQVIGYGLELKEQVERGDRISVPHEMTKLKGLLNGPSELRSDPDYYGTSGDLRRTQAGGDPGFLGARYALTCWLDEIFILDSPYEKEWKENMLEWELFRSNDRAEQFWEQWRKAEGRPGSDALEVYYWCVILGFRGAKRGSPQELRNLCDAARERIKRTYRDEAQLPADQGFVTHVPRLVGQERFGNMVRLAGAVVLAAVPFFVYFVVRGLDK